MARIYTLNSENSNQAIVELPVSNFKTKRVFWIYNNSPESIRGRHRHKKSIHILHCVVGSCKVMVNTGFNRTTYILKNNNQILCLKPSEWREMYEFSEDCVLMCLSNELYDSSDYIYTPNIASPKLKLDVCDFSLI
jgi:dTDP-4-dehydrorhamnose 3,5-epimerase-like enzyme